MSSTADPIARTGKITDFRLWLQRRWQEHCNEFDVWFHRSPELTSSEYFRKYRWWLRQEFRKQR